MTPDDANLIHEFAVNHSQAAFTALVQRHLDVVYAAALRQVNGDSGLACDVAQAVFIDLARKAQHLPRNLILAAWLHRATRLGALAALRAQHRRITREQEALRMQEIERSSESGDWQSVSGVIDEALDKLPAQDREAVLLRFFQKQNFREIGTALKTSEDAARMRVDRALDKLRGYLSQRGITSTSAALAAALAAHVSQAAPAGLAATIATTAAAAAVSSSLIPLTLMASAKLKIGIAAAVAAGALAFATREHINNRTLANEVAQLHEQLQRSQPGQPAVTAQSNTTGDAVELARLQAERAELLRLRGEVALLRAEKEKADKLLAEQRQPAAKPDEAPINADEETYKSVSIARMNYVQGWAVAMLTFAGKNDGRMPKDFAEAARFYPEKWSSLMSAFDRNNLEILYHGSLNNVPSPERTIILREKAIFSNPDQTRTFRTYLFADGHTEIHSAPDGNFEAWEKQHMAQP